MFAVLPHDSDWAKIAEITKDPSWDPEVMRKYFTRMEKCEYLPRGTPGHGFDGWLHTSHVDEVFLENGDHEVIESALSVEKGRFQHDVNSASPRRDFQQGVFQATLHMTKDGKRSSVQTFLADTVNARNSDGSKKYPLTIRTNSLVTKVLFDNNYVHKPRAIGVEFLKGKSLYAADPRFNKHNYGLREHVYASKEVIVSGGAFNTPQILKLSGIGPANELQEHRIPVIADLPGVGTNLQDNYEFGVVSKASTPFSVYSKCTFGETGDLCLKQWAEGHGPYRGDGIAAAIFHTSSVSRNKENDLFLYGGPLKFTGFFPGYSRVQDPSAFTWGVLKQHPRNSGRQAGTVTLNSADPRAVPRIRFNFLAKGEDEDLQAMAEAVERIRKVIKGVTEPTGPFTEEVPGPAVQAIDEVKQSIKDQIFSHHATSSCKIGADNDEFAVLDSRFRVRGVDGLRVVDASIFPHVPGSFPAIPIMMVSEKASDVILEDHRNHHQKLRKHTINDSDLGRENTTFEEPAADGKPYKKRKTVLNGKKY
jgi:choline dehydrogenase